MSKNQSKFDGQWVRVRDWSNFNPAMRKGVRRTWFRLNCDFFLDPYFSGVSPIIPMVFLFILGLCCKQDSAKVMLSPNYFTLSLNIRVLTFDRAIEYLLNIGYLELTQSALSTDLCRPTRQDSTLQNITRQTNTKEVCSVRSKKPNVPKASAPHPKLADASIGDLIGKLNRAAQDAWLETYPDENWIKQELRKANAWILSNPQKAPRSNFTKFVNSWLARGWEQHRKTLSPNFSPSPAGSSSLTPEQIREIEAETKRLDEYTRKIKTGEIYADRKNIERNTD